MFRLLTTALLIVSHLAIQASAKKNNLQLPDCLTIGSVAPPLDVEHWYGEATQPLKSGFETDHIYVVEFWATWCGPCVAGMPHLAELQRKYADKKVTVIGISDEEPDVVDAFLERRVPGKKDAQRQTYGELTSAYRLASDPDQSTHDDYLFAALQYGIPTAFVVGKTGHIEWIGSPSDLDEVLEDLLADAWDRKKFAREFKQEQHFTHLDGVFHKSLEDQDFDQAREVIAAYEAMPDAEDAKENARQLKSDLDFALILQSMKNEPEVGSKQLKDFFAKLRGKSRSLFFRAEGIVAAANEDRSAVNDDQLHITAATCEAELADAESDEGILLNVLGHLHHVLGDHDKAVEFHQRAVDYAKAKKSRQARWFESDLKDLLAEHAKKQLSTAK